jgi:hypothetical protein
MWPVLSITKPEPSACRGTACWSGGASDGLSDAVVVDVICTTPGAARA